MNLVDVKNALETITTLNPGLSKDKLVVLLKAANWEDVNIREAVTVFESVSQELALPHVDKENLLEKKINLPHIDGQNLLEAKNVQGIESVEKKEINKQTEPTLTSSLISEKVQKVFIRLPFSKKETKQTEQVEAVKPLVVQDNHLPEGLPLKAFDSSEHVWTFSEYKEKFHGGLTPAPQVLVPGEVAKILQTSVEKPKAPVTQEVVVQKPASVLPQNPIRKTIVVIDEPLTGSDLSLVVVVSFLFLVIILLLGYMYSNGRLFL